MTALAIDHWSLRGCVLAGSMWLPASVAATPRRQRWPPRQLAARPFIRGYYLSALQAFHSRESAKSVAKAFAPSVPLSADVSFWRDRRGNILCGSCVSRLTLRGLPPKAVAMISGFRLRLLRRAKWGSHYPGLGLSPKAAATMSEVGGLVIRLTPGTTINGSSMVMAPAIGTPSWPHCENNVTALINPTVIPA